MVVRRRRRLGASPAASWPHPGETGPSSRPRSRHRGRPRLRCHPFGGVAGRHERVHQHQRRDPSRALDGVPEGHHPAVAVPDHRRRSERGAEAVEIVGQLGEGVARGGPLGAAVAPLVVEEDAVAAGHHRRQAEVPRGDVAGDHPVDHDHRRVAGLAHGLGVEPQPVDGHVRHVSTKSTTWPTVSPMISSSSIPAIQSTNSTGLAVALAELLGQGHELDRLELEVGGDHRLGGDLEVLDVLLADDLADQLGHGGQDLRPGRRHRGAGGCPLHRVTAHRAPLPGRPLLPAPAGSREPRRSRRRDPVPGRPGPLP